MSDKFEDLTFEREVTHHIGEHEIMISFNNDSGAEAFDEWWHDVGSKLFMDWIKEHDYWKNEI